VKESLLVAKGGDIRTSVRENRREDARGVGGGKGEAWLRHSMEKGFLGGMFGEVERGPQRRYGA